jgi:hypothetical protein
MLLSTSALVFLLGRFHSPDAVAFVPVVMPRQEHRYRQRLIFTQPLQRWQSDRSFPRIQTLLHASPLPDIGGMRVGDIRKELESYGISTSSFLEKKEMVQALEKARAEGKLPVNGASGSGINGDLPNGATNSTSASTDTRSRSDRLEEEMDKANTMKVGELKKELQALGISTKSFFEKAEFVKAYAEAIVDGVSKRGKRAVSEEPRDPTYRDVVLQRMTRGDPRALQGTVIDVTPKK